jgi:hypothetical protein
MFQMIPNFQFQFSKLFPDVVSDARFAIRMGTDQSKFIKFYRIENFNSYRCVRYAGDPSKANEYAHTFQTEQCLILKTWCVN